jgi:hypothetical protein
LKEAGIGTRVAVLGLGTSLSEFNPSEFDLSIGVNDIWRYVKSDVVICLDKRTIFSYERLKVIDSCTPKAFYSQIVNWDTRPDFVKINFIPGYPDNFVQLETRELHKSYCSPFVACQIAYKYYGATEIYLFGVDLTNHPHLDKVICDKIKVHFRNLKKALEEKGCKLIVHGSGILKDL